MSKKSTKTETNDSPAEFAASSSGGDARPAAELIDLSAPAIQGAISQGKTVIADGKSKADAARAIFQIIGNESKDVLVAAFVAGAALTPKGALTYWYNCKRRAAKQR